MGNYLPLKSTPNFFSHSSAAFVDVETTDQNNWAYSGLILDIDITGTFTGTSLTFTIEGKDPGSGTYYDILTTAALTGIGHTNLVIHPAVAVVANATASTCLPQTWRVSTTETDMTAITFALSSTLVP